MFGVKYYAETLDNNIHLATEWRLRLIFKPQNVSEYRFCAVFTGKWGRQIDVDLYKTSRERANSSHVRDWKIYSGGETAPHNTHSHIVSNTNKKEEKKRRKKREKT